MVLAEIQKKPQRGVRGLRRSSATRPSSPSFWASEAVGCCTDVVPVVSFKGWPAVAQSWLMENHFWDGKITEEEVISGFYLLPACSSTGQKENEWRLSFARSEVQLKKCISASLMQAYQACKALIIKLLSRPKAISPYHLRSLMLWACDRLPHTYLAQEDYAAHFLLGLIDDLQHCLVNKTCPNYFIPQCNMLEHLSDDMAMLHARKLSSVRSDPAEHLRSAIEHAKAASRLTHELQWRGGSSNLLSPLSENWSRSATGRPAREEETPAAGHGESWEVHLCFYQPRWRYATSLSHRWQILLKPPQLIWLGTGCKRHHATSFLNRWHIFLKPRPLIWLGAGCRWPHISIDDKLFWSHAL